MLQRKENLKTRSCVSQYTYIHAVNLPLDIFAIRENSFSNCTALHNKSWHPLRPIVSSRSSITYRVVKELAYIIKPLVGQSPHHLKNTEHFVQQIHSKRLEPGEVMTSFDVKASLPQCQLTPPSI